MLERDSGKKSGNVFVGLLYFTGLVVMLVGFGIGVVLVWEGGMLVFTIWALGGGLCGIFIMAFGELLSLLDDIKNNTNALLKINQINPEAAVSYDLYVDEAHKIDRHEHDIFEEEAYTNGVHKEEAYTNGAHTEEAYTNGVHKEEAYTNGAHKEEAYTNDANKEEEQISEKKESPSEFEKMYLSEIKTEYGALMSDFDYERIKNSFTINGSVLADEAIVPTPFAGYCIIRIGEHLVVVEHGGDEPNELVKSDLMKNPPLQRWVEIVRGTIEQQSSAT